MVNLCSRPQCDRGVYSRRLCTTHYERQRRGDYIDAPIGRKMRKNGTYAPDVVAAVTTLGPVPLPMHELFDWGRRMVRLYGHHLSPEQTGV